MRRGSVGIALVLVAAVLTGCVGGSDEAGNPEPTAGTQAGPGSLGDGASSGNRAAGNLSAVTFPVEGFTNTTLWANGSYQAHEGCVTGGCDTGSAFHEHELSSELADQAPTQVRVELTYDPGTIPGLDHLGLGIYSQSGTFYTFDYEGEPGRDQVELTFRKDADPLVVQVFYGGPNHPPPEIEYALKITTSVDPTLVVPRMPIEVPAETGQGFTMTSTTGSGTIELMVYDQQDRFITRLTGENGRLETHVPSSVGSGDHVLVATSQSPAFRIETNRSEVSMRPLGYDVQLGDLHPVSGTEAVTWSFQPDRLPVAVGVYALQQGALYASLAQGQVEVTGPEGALLSGGFGCNICLATGYGSYWTTSIGEPGIVPGSYEVTYTPTGEAGGAVGHLLVHYER